MTWSTTANRMSIGGKTKGTHTATWYPSRPARTPGLLTPNAEVADRSAVLPHIKTCCMRLEWSAQFAAKIHWAVLASTTHDR